jgi:hypothetical protein
MGGRSGIGILPSRDRDCAPFFILSLVSIRAQGGVDAYIEIPNGLASGLMLRL